MEITEEERLELELLLEEDTTIILQIDAIDQNNIHCVEFGGEEEFLFTWEDVRDTLKVVERRCRIIKKLMGRVI